MLSMRFLSRLLGLLMVLLVMTLAFARAAPPNLDPVRIERDGFARKLGGFATARLLSAFLARDSGQLEAVRRAKRFDSLTLSAHYSSGILDCPLDPRSCERITLSLYGWQADRPTRLGQEVFPVDALVSQDRAQAMRLERSSSTGLTAVLERLVYDGHFGEEVWLLIRPDDSKGQLPPDSAIDRSIALKRLQRQLLAEEGFNVADSALNADTSGPAMPEISRWFHLLGSVTQRNVETIGASTIGLLSTMLGIDPVRDIQAAQTQGRS